MEKESQVLLTGPDRHSVPGVTAGIYRRPIDRPKAETHPPKNSMNVFLVDSREVFIPLKSPGALALLWLLLPIFHGFLLVYPVFIGHQNAFL